jgi:hypothetical protein
MSHAFLRNPAFLFIFRWLKGGGALFARVASACDSQRSATTRRPAPSAPPSSLGAPPKSALPTSGNALQGEQMSEVLIHLLSIKPRG